MNKYKTKTFKILSKFSDYFTLRHTRNFRHYLNTEIHRLIGFFRGTITFSCDSFLVKPVLDPLDNTYETAINTASNIVLARLGADRSNN